MCVGYTCQAYTVSECIATVATCTKMTICPRALKTALTIPDSVKGVDNNSNTTSSTAIHQRQRHHLQLNSECTQLPALYYLVIVKKSYFCFISIVIFPHKY